MPGRLFSSAILFFFFASAQAAPKPLHVMIDPGHGGHDTGAVKGSLRESVIALKVSQQLADLLRKDPRFKVSMTRTSDQRVSLEKRTELAHEKKADVFVSIHLNSNKDPRARGTEIYFQNQVPADEEALFLASRENEEEGGQASAVAREAPKGEALSPRTDLKNILDDLRRNHRITASSDLSKQLIETWSVQPKSKHIRQAPFYVVSEINIPSILVELGFLTHPQEGPQLGQAAYQAQLARNLYSGLVKYKERVDNSSRENLKSPQ